MLALAGRVLFGPGVTARALRYLVVAGGWALLASLWWIVPQLLTLRSGALVITANTDVRAWA